MSAGEYCNREVVVANKSESIREAVYLMRKHHVGTVIVVEEQDTTSVPVGVLTDRDIVIEILAQDIDIDSVSIADVMSFELVCVGEETKLLDAVSLMRSKGIRRLPVVDSEGGLAGILTVDDVIELLAEQISNISGLVANEQQQEQARRT